MNSKGPMIAQTPDAAKTTHFSLVGDFDVVQSPNYMLEKGTTPIDDSTIMNEGSKWDLMAKILIMLFVLSYSLAAFILDFHRAKALFYIELVVFIIAGWCFIYRKYSQEINTAYLSIKSYMLKPMVFRSLSFSMFVFIIVMAILPARKDPYRLVSGAGLVVYILICYACSNQRSSVNWRPVIAGFVMQFIFALFILRTDEGFEAFKFVGEQMGILIDYTTHGSEFVFGYLVRPIKTEDELLIPVFAFAVLTAGIFFSALVSILNYLKLIQPVIRVVGKGISFVMGTSISESVNAAGNIFLSALECGILLRPFLKDMTKSELHAVMTGGFATIAGGVLAIYIKQGINPTHLISASAMSAPAALAISKLVYPETEDSPTREGDYVVNNDEDSASNVIEAACKGIIVGMKIIGNVAAMLIGFLALIAMLNAWIQYFGSLVGYENASFTGICGYLFYPFAFLMGIPREDCQNVGELIGLKIFTNEFVAYKTMLEMQGKMMLTQRSVDISTYALCGFSNFATIGIVVGSFGSLAPSRYEDISSLVLSAMISANVACFMTACIAGLLL